MQIAVTIKENGIKRQGNGIWQVKVRNNFFIPDAPYTILPTGDAIAIPIGRGRIFLATLHTWNPRYNNAECNTCFANIQEIPILLFYDEAMSTDKALPDIFNDIARMVGTRKRLPCSVSKNVTSQSGQSKPQESLLCLRTAIAEDKTGIRKIHLLKASCYFYDSACAIKIRSIDVTIVETPPIRHLSSAFPWIDKYENDDRHAVQNNKLPDMGLFNILRIKRI